ncbi:unnamed protein product [Euphydryas editha]|uniref:Uncharacterized protein n=1 Tax=Euphydryas editha TaxID=104508 RepID=A0AAU9VFQ7_EUPED|nr:unnamed protein product [Euphydryas editha]
METSNRDSRIGPLPGGERRGTSGAGAGRDSMWTASDSSLNRRARVGGPENITAEGREEETLDATASDTLRSREISPARSAGTSALTTEYTSDDARRKWSPLELEELMYCYYKAKAGGVGYIKRLEILFKTRNPHNPKSDKFNEILERIRKQAEGIELDNTGPVLNTIEEASTTPTQIHTTQSNVHHTPEQAEIINQLTENIQVNEDQDPLILQFLQILAETKETPLADRLFLPKAKINKQFMENLNTLNNYLPNILITNDTLQEINNIIYATAKTLIINNKQIPYVPKATIPQKSDPPWKKRIKDKINKFRKKLGRNRHHTRMLCVNCNICVNTLSRYQIITLDSRGAAVLCSWVYPRVVLEEDIVCETCRDLAMFSVNENFQQDVSGNADQQAGPSHQGHTNVCLLCGLSTLRRRSDKILRSNPSELQLCMIAIIESRVQPRKPQVSQSEEATHSVNEVTLPDYRRAANTNHHYVFPNCGNDILRSISEKLRAIMLNTHNYYLPQQARVCDDHLMGNTLDTLFHSQNSYASFTVQQIQHVFSFVNALNVSIDFENVDEMDESVFQYWVGHADIINKLFCDGSALREYFECDDVFILDRSFRDSISLLEGCGFRDFMPESLSEGEHQLTTAQANKSRCVTICRWVVEAINGHFKRDFKLLRQEYFISL